MAPPGVLVAQSLKIIACFGRAFHIKGALVVIADEDFSGLASVSEHAGHLRLLHRGEAWFA